MNSIEKLIPEVILGIVLTGVAVYVSSMNAGLLGRIIGGTIAEVMGGSVSKDQKQVLSILRK